MPQSPYTMGNGNLVREVQHLRSDVDRAKGRERQAIARAVTAEDALSVWERSVFAEVRDERIRAHTKHGDTSMESSPPATLRRLAILAEEVGEVAREFNDAEHAGRPVDLAKLRKELIQTAAMAAAWADACATSDTSESGENDDPRSGRLGARES